MSIPHKVTTNHDKICRSEPSLLAVREMRQGCCFTSTSRLTTSPEELKSASLQLRLDLIQGPFDALKLNDAISRHSEILRLACVDVSSGKVPCGALKRVWS